MNRSSSEAWDDDVLQTEPDAITVVDKAKSEEIDASAGTQLVSIRMQKSMIDAFKTIAAANKNIGYQTLMKQILHRFIEQEMKRVWSEHLEQLQQVESRKSKPEDSPRGKEKARKAA